MSLNTKCADFSEQVFFVGLDTHKSNWKTTIRTKDVVLKTFSMNPSPEQLSVYMRTNYPNGIYKSVYEAGFCGFWIHRKLTALNFKNIIVNPADVPSTNKERERKSDPIDSRKLSRELANDSLTGIFVPNEHQEALRCICRLFKQYTRRVTQLKNRVKGYLHFIGVNIPLQYEGSCWSNNFLQYLSNVTCPDKLHKVVLEDHINEFKHARKKKLDILKEIRKISKEVRTIGLLKTIPGVGTLTAFSLYVEIADINRFKNLDTLASYVGLVPSIQSSDQTEIVGGLSFRHNKHLRSALVESAWVAIRHDSALLSAYNHLVNRMDKSKAIIRIAKKLLNRIYFVWRNQSEYVKGVVEIIK